MPSPGLCRLIKGRNSSTESEISESDEEWAIIVKRKKRQKRYLHARVENYATKVVEKYTEFEFKSHFRISRAKFECLLRAINVDLIRKVKGCQIIPARHQLMIALWKMVTMDSYRSICDRFNVGKATAVRSVRRVTEALFHLAQKVIQWPSGGRADIIMRGFEEASGFPQIIGVIDGTHIHIDAPKENAVDYVNRKGYHSIHLQVVCDHRALITHCFTGHPGSVHDQRVFRRSEVAEFLNDEERFPANSHIIGDAAYELHYHLLVPFRDNGHLNARQRNYNYRLSSARTTVERCFALLKGRLRSLLDRLPMMRIDLVPEYVVACCVIHNICILNTDEFAALVIEEQLQENNLPVEPLHNQFRPDGVHKRNYIVDFLPVV